ncbi:FIMAH domain-containing protein [Brachybacterium sp. AOP42-C2-15]|uniref:FIMAH domain-containing protein n=1 Tax=unclassified Brachybacterium TaxID=2623841 RepID=UPI004034E764
MAARRRAHALSRRVFLGSGVGAAAALTAAPGLAAPDGRDEEGAVEGAPTIVDHGTVPLTATTVAGAATGTMPDGSPRLWAVVSGSPAYLAEIDPLAGTLEGTYPLPGASGAWGVAVAEDGTVWTSSYMDGSLYYLVPGATEVRSDGRPTPDTSFLWQVDTDADGIAYSGTFQGWADSPLPPGHLVSYDRSTEEWRDLGTFGEGLNYVRSTAVIGQTVYAGTGSIAALFAVDIATGKASQVPLPDGHDDCTFVYELAASGTDLYTKIECDGSYVGFVYDTTTGQWSDEIGPLNSQSVGLTGDGVTYFTLDGELAFRTADGELVSTGKAFGTKGVGVTSDESGAEWVVAISNRGLVHRYDIAAGVAETVQVGLDGGSVTPRSTAMGPDGRVHVGGYLSGGLATFDPASGEWSSKSGLGQAEGMVTHGETLYAGVYPGARLYEIDTSAPWGEEEDNPRQVMELGESTHQDRPFGMASAGDLVAVGTVAGYGVLKGSLALYDPATETWDEYHDLITDQSIVALDAHDGVVFGGTSVFGGNGIEPSQDSAVVFAFDLESRQLLWTTPVNGLAVTAITVAKDEVWAATVGELLALDPAGGELVHEHEVEPVDWGSFPNGLWSSADLHHSEADGLIYGSVSDHIVRIDPTTREVDELPDASGDMLVLAEDSTIYWVNGGSLFSAVWSGPGDPSPDPITELEKLQKLLGEYVGTGDVAGSLATRLTNSLIQAHRHLNGGRRKTALIPIERFVRQLEASSGSDTLSEEAKEELRPPAVALLALLG